MMAEAWPLRARTSPTALCGHSTGRSRLLEPVSDAIEGRDHVEARVDRLELLAQALDVAVDRAVVHKDLIVVRGVHQGVAALHHAGALRERPQEQELGHGERHRLALPGAGVALGIHGELAALQRLGVGLAWGSGRVLRREAAQHRFDALDQQALRERLPDEVVRPYRQAGKLVDLLVLRGEEDYRQIGLLAQAAQELHSV